jgi:hypothetical protein
LTPSVGTGLPGKAYRINYDIQEWIRRCDQLTLEEALGVTTVNEVMCRGLVDDWNLLRRKIGEVEVGAWTS